jgi:uncharacterized radical SAM superfamily Fe-S cluster-containing enzyme
MTFVCPTCGEDIPTRVLADHVTLVVVGECPRHGVLEVSRVSLQDSGHQEPHAA